MKLAIDFDGTIIDASRRDYALYVSIMCTMQHDVLTFEEYWPLRKQSVILGKLLAMTGCTDVGRYAALRHLHAEDEAFQIHNSMLPGAFEALERLSRHHSCYLVTARANRENLLREVKQFDLERFFVQIVNTAGPKLQALKDLGIEAIIGDTENDVEPALALGIKSIAVTSGIRSRAFLESFLPDMILENISEVPNTILT